MNHRRKTHLKFQVNDRIDATAFVSLNGELDEESGLEFRSAVCGLMDDGIQHLVLNVEEINKIDCAGLDSLLGAMNRLRRRHGSVSLVARNAVVERVWNLARLSQFDVARLSQMVQVFSSDQEAHRILKPPPTLE